MDACGQRVHSICTISFTFHLDIICQMIEEHLYLLDYKQIKNVFPICTDSASLLQDNQWQTDKFIERENLEGRREK